MAQNAKKAVKEEPLTLEDIQKLVTMLDKSGLHEMEVEIGGTRLKLAKPSPPAQSFVLPQRQKYTTMAREDADARDPNSAMESFAFGGDSARSKEMTFLN